MAVFDQEAQRIVVEVVYDGPAYAGKTTNLEQLCGFFTEHRRSRLFSTAGSGERTLYLDWLQLEGGIAAGHKLRCQMITVPGQTALARRRLHLLKRADVVVFVLESTREGVQAARPAFQKLKQVASELGRDLPIIIQANKQDMVGCLGPEQVARILQANPEKTIAAQAESGVGVLETAILAIRAVADLVQRRVLAEGLESLSGVALDGEGLMQQMIQLERDNPKRPLDIVIEHSGVDYTPEKTQPTLPAAPRLPSSPAENGTALKRPMGSLRPPLPESAVPSGLIWPSASGRDVLRRVPLQEVEWRQDLAAQVGTQDGSGRGDTVVVEAGLWCLKTSLRRRYADVDSARNALLLLARRKISLGTMLTKNTVLTLQDDDTGYWLWTVTPWLTTMRGALSYAQQHHDQARLTQTLVDYADAALESLQLALKQHVLLDVHPSNFARLGTRTYYVDDDIGSGQQLPAIGHSLLRRVDEFKDFPEATEAYIARLTEGFQQQLSANDAERLCLKQALTTTVVGTSAGEEARRQLLGATP